MLLALVAAACARQERPRTDFDGQAALSFVRSQLDFGPRIPGSIGHRRTGDWIVAQMRQRADTVIEQRWAHVTTGGDTLPLRNIFARFRPGASDRILYLTHWDTRPISDQAQDPSQRQLPVPGANDGASGVALLMALGDVLKKTPPRVGVDLLFVDGEDYGDFSKKTDVLLGSTYFAQHLPSPDYRPLFGVLWDMIGDRDLNIFQEQNSVNAAPEVVARVWSAAQELGYGRFFIPEVTEAITDDHVPLIKKGLRVIDVIDLDYGPPLDNGDATRPAATYHHTLQDTIDKISARSLQIVGDVATALLLPR